MTAKKLIQKQDTIPATIGNESGRIGYFIAWLFGVPVSVLFFIFLIRGH